MADREEEIAAYALRARERWSRRDYEGAIADASWLIEADPRLAAWYELRARCHAEMGQLRSALTDAEKALSLDPRCPHAHATRARILEELSEHLDARPAAKPRRKRRDQEPEEEAA